MLNSGNTRFVTELGRYHHIQFICVAEGVPAIDKIWWDIPFNGNVLTEIELVDGSVHSTMTLNTTMEYQHSGQYICRASNSVIKRFLVYHVIVKGELPYFVCSARFGGMRALPDIHVYA